MRKALLSLLFLPVAVMAQTADPVVMRIAGEAVTRSEFEYNYNKNNTDDVVDRKTVDEYVPMFVAYKLKVRAAQDAQLDTLSSYQKEFRQYRDQQIRPLLVPEGASEAAVRKYYDGMKAQLGGKDLRQMAHIFLRLPQQATAEQQAQAKTRIDSISAALASGAPFEDLARRLSDDQGTAARGGLLPQWIGPGALIPVLETTLYALRDSGEVSQPVQSPVGYHIVQLRGHKNLEPYEELQPQIARYLERQGLAERLAHEAVDTLAKQRGMTADEILDAETERLTANDAELRYLVKEYHDGLLLFEICSREVWEPAARDTAGMERYFADNRAAYAYDKPHFRGMVYYCQAKKDVKAVRKLLKKTPEEKWIAAVRGAFNKDSITVRMEQRVFAQGENGYVDSLALKQKHVTAKAKTGYPWAAVVGKTLKKGPERWTDVREQLVSDYQGECDRRYVEELKKRYTVETYPDVIATVNKH